MRKHWRSALFLALAAALAVVPAQAQIKLEITGFGGFGFNMAFASNMTIDSGFADNIGFYYDEWLPFFNDPVLELKAGPGFGGRAALWFTPMFGLEGSFEYSLQKPRFNEAAVTGLEAKMDAIDFSEYFSMTAEGGRMMRVYGNLVVNLMPGAKFSPYLTAGIGMTSYTVEPEIAVERADLGEALYLFYDTKSALTFNGGGGFKAWFTPMIGLRVDARVFFGSPKLAQMYSYKVFGTQVIPEGNYVTQSGSHIDAVITVGLVIRIGS